MIAELRARIDRLQGERNLLADQLRDAQDALATTTEELSFVEEAQSLIQTVAQKTQQSLEYRLSELTSLAMESVFSQPYKLRVSFEMRRGRTETDLLFVDEIGVEHHPLDSSGGGAVDVASFALRLSLWCLSVPRTSPVIILDEPFRFLSTDLQPKAAQMVREMSQRLGVQFIIVTHEEELLDSADRVFLVSKQKDVSNVKEGKSQ